ncbi:MAG: HEAT repeat domain-containing protein [Planctomycetes bacterium]|nr:HEAT repeat domain-containing protein [Planctomycetota bacterium]
MNFCNKSVFALACVILSAGCKSSEKSNTPEPFNASPDDKPKSIGVVITTLDNLLAQWNDAMNKPETKQTLDRRFSLTNEIRKYSIQRFEELKLQLETSRVGRNREIIAAALGFSNKTEALNPLLTAALQDPDPSVREKGLLGLSRLADKNTPVELIADRLNVDYTEGEQWNASVALKRLAEAGTKMQPALPMIRKGLNHRNPTIRVHCAIALGAAHDAQSTPLLVTLLKDDRALVAAAAANALGQIGDPEVASALIDAMASTEYALRTEARAALTRMNSGQDLGADLGPWRRWLQHLELSPKKNDAPASRPANLPDSQPAAAAVNK